MLFIIPIVILALLAVACFFLWKCSALGEEYREIWVNLLAGFIASFIMVVVIEQLLKLHEEQKKRPLLIAAYREVQMFVSRINVIWISACKQYVDNWMTISHDALYSDTTFSRILQGLNLEDAPENTLAQNWISYLDEKYNSINFLGNSILNRYITVLDPEVIYSLHRLVNDSELLGRLSDLKSMWELNKKMDVPNYNRLDKYIKPDADDFSWMKDITKWCEDIYPKIKDEPSIFPVAKKFSTSSMTYIERIEFEKGD